MKTKGRREQRAHTFIRLQNTFIIMSKHTLFSFHIYLHKFYIKKSYLFQFLVHEFC